jgi:inner membrane protein
MRAPTHAAFGLVVAIAAGTGLGLRLTPATAALACAGALVPDVDTPTTWAGCAGGPVARLLERRFGPRTVGHSLLGLAAATLASLPLAGLDAHAPLAVALGYASHLLLDCATTAGVPLFYPSPIRAVLPRAETLRLPEGARAEWILAAALALALAILLPLQQMGFARALHALTQTTGGAISDYRRWQGQRLVWVDVEGLFQPSGRRVRQRYRVLGLANTSTLVVLDPATDRIHTVGPTAEANVYPLRVRAEPGPPVTIQTRPVVLTQQLLRDVLQAVPPDGDTLLQGEVSTPDTPRIRPDPEQYAVLKPGVSGLEFRYARPRDLADPAIGALFVVAGVVLVQTTLSREPTAHRPAALPAPTDSSPPAYDDVTELFIAHLTDHDRELLVREGDRVHQGQLLARLTWQDPELQRRHLAATAQLAEREAALAVHATALRQARALVAVQLAAPGAEAQAEAAHQRAEADVAQARRALDRLADEARRQTEIRAPVDGQVLTVRVHVIHGSEGTAALRLLYRRRPAAPVLAAA